MRRLWLGLEIVVPGLPPLELYDSTSLIKTTFIWFFKTVVNVFLKPLKS